MKAEVSSRLIPRKLAANLKLLSRLSGSDVVFGNTSECRPKHLLCVTTGMMQKL